jgi:hypothetical protein
MWMLAGAAVFLVASLLVLHFRSEPTPAGRLESKARTLELVDRMRGTLALASESEKNAVLAASEDDSRVFADEARTATSLVEQGRIEVDGLLQAEGTEGERQILGDFSRAFAALRTIDDELLGLAVENSNVKAYRLAYGPAASALQELTDALSRLATPGASDSAGSGDDGEVLRLAFGAAIAALRVQSLLPPHIAEESNEKMDAIESRLAEQEQQVGRDLEELRARPELASRAELESARSSWVRFRELETQILALSRENTNVRSLAISLNGKRKAMLACQAALTELRTAIAQEPVAGMAFSPR